jgi:hypothetical protein
MMFKGNIVHSRFAIRIFVPRSSDAGIEHEAKATTRLEYVERYRCAVGGEGAVGSWQRVLIVSWDRFLLKLISHQAVNGVRNALAMPEIAN